MSDPRAALGQYFTPQEVVHLAYDLLVAADPHTRAPKLIDPACGEGVFLRVALERGLTAPERCYGLDRDPSVVDAWQRQGWWPNAAGPHLSVHDGLCEPTSSLRWLRDADFDWVVGNPPYAGQKLRFLRGLDPALLMAGEHAALCRALANRLTLWRRGRPNRPLTAADLRALSTFPIELLFLERFTQLARPGGLIAIVLPDGVLANRRHRFVREWLLDRLTVHAVVALPRHAFRRSGASAKTNLVVATKSAPRRRHRIALLDAVDGLQPDQVAELVDSVSKPAGP